MKIRTRNVFCLLLVLGCAGWSDAQEKTAAQITIHVPEKGHANTTLKINDGEAFDVDGDTYVYKTELAKGKEQKVKIEALIQPNNYTKITRIKTITLKGGDKAAVDLTKKDPKEKIVVRWVPTPDDIVDEMCKMAKVGKKDVVYDLGCGDAVMLIRPILKFNAKKGVGIDIDPKILEKARENVKKSKLEERIELRVGDILNVKDMSDATVVLLYIGDNLGERLSPVLQRTLKPGARIVSHRFRLGDWEPTRSVSVKGADNDTYELHLWVVGAKKTVIDKEKN